jgi:two-component system, OmpR family, response regulator ArlR
MAPQGRILIVEDEEKIARFLELELTHEGYEVAKAADGRTALSMALEGRWSLVLLDVMLPELSGLEVLRRLRRESEVPVILLTARDAVMDKVAGLDAGANDYITKPLAIEELLARIRVVLRLRPAASRQTQHASVDDAPTVVQDESQVQPEGTITVGQVTLDPSRRLVLVDGEAVELTMREFDVLRVLMVNAGIVLSREKIASLACGYDYLGETNIVDVYVRHLRAKIDDRFGIKLVSSVRGVGYVIREA